MSQQPKQDQAFRFNNVEFQTELHVNTGLHCAHGSEGQRLKCCYWVTLQSGVVAPIQKGNNQKAFLSFCTAIHILSKPDLSVFRLYNVWPALHLPLPPRNCISAWQDHMWCPQLDKTSTCALTQQHQLWRFSYSSPVFSCWPTARPHGGPAVDICRGSRNLTSAESSRTPQLTHPYYVCISPVCIARYIGWCGCQVLALTHIWYTVCCSIFSESQCSAVQSAMHTRCVY